MIERVIDVELACMALSGALLIGSVALPYFVTSLLMQAFLLRGTQVTFSHLAGMHALACAGALIALCWYTAWHQNFASLVLLLGTVIMGIELFGLRHRVTLRVAFIAILAANLCATGMAVVAVRYGLPRWI